LVSGYLVFMFNSYTYKIIFLPLLIVVCFAFFFALSSPVSAYEDVVLKQEQYSAQLNIESIIQNFTPTSTLNVDYFEIYDQATSTVNIYFCKGYGGNGHAEYGCGTSTLMATFMNQLIGDGYTRLEFLSTQTFSNGQNYFFKINHPDEDGDDADLFTVGCKAGTNPYLGGEIYRWNTGPGPWESRPVDDLTFRLIGNSSEVDWTYDWFQLGESYPDVYMPIQQVCLLSDQWCNLEYWYNEQAIGADLYFIYDNGQEISPANSSTSTTITYQTGYMDSLYLASSTVNGIATTTEFCILYNTPGYGEVKECGMILIWVEDDYFPTMPSGFCEATTTEEICSGISTSTDWFGIDFGYAFECGGRRLIHWMVCPSEDSFEMLETTINQWETMFPYSVFSQITNAFIDSQATTTAFTINITTLTGIEGHDTELALLEEGMMLDTWGVVWEKVYALMEYVLYFFGFLAIMMILLGQGTFSYFRSKFKKHDN
jgi:hypothetical protein